MQERKPHRIEQRAAAFSSQAENRESGQNLLEFAAVLALALVFLFAAVEISSVFQQKSDLDNMVRQAAQQAGEFGGGKDEVEAFIRKQMEYQGYSNQSISAAV
ncbi:MAG: TadE family protein, partial [Chloroflexota bacterium]